MPDQLLLHMPDNLLHSVSLHSSHRLIDHPPRRCDLKLGVMQIPYHGQTNEDHGQTQEQEGNWHYHHEAGTRNALLSVRCSSVSACTHADRPTELCATILQALKEICSNYTLAEAWESASNDSNICLTNTDIGPHRHST